MMNEIPKFDALAHDWWDSTGPMRALHALNPVRLAYIQNHIDLGKKRVLDVGCGAGLLTEAMATAGATVKGIDLSPAVLEVAREHVKQNTDMLIDYELIDTAVLAEREPQSYDVITCMEMLEHVAEPDHIIHSCAALLKPGGYLFFSTINRHPKAFLFAIVGAEYILNWLPKGTHTYSQFIRPSELDQWARHAHLQRHDMRGLSHVYPSHSFVLSADVRINYIACYRKIGSYPNSGVHAPC